MLGGGDLNPRKMQQMMEQMGIDVTELDATEVVIRTPDADLVFDAPDVTRMDARGQQTYQVVGEPVEEDSGSGGRVDESPAVEDEGADEAAAIPQEDIELVVERAGVDADTAREALAEADGDLAAAIDRFE